LKEEGVTSFDQYLFDVDKPHLGSKLWGECCAIWLFIFKPSLEKPCW
jgi:hypothetical protein